MAKKKSRYKDVTIKPAQGGKLMSRSSAAEAGVQNYVIKREFRRDLDVEMRREGHDWFGDFQGEVNTSGQPFPTSDKITLIHMARSPSGATAVIVGTATTLYQFQSLTYNYIDQITPAGPDPGGNYVDGVGSDPFFANYDWAVIGSGFSASGRRWEAVNINGYTVFNNGVDLPVIFRLEWGVVAPMHELRDQNVSRVGTIAAFNNVLMMADIHQIPTTSFMAWMNGSDPYGVYTNGDESRYQYRILWSALGEPSQFDVTVGCTTTTGGSASDITLDWPSESFAVDDSVTIYGAGIAGGNLSTTIASISTTTVTLNDPAQTATTTALLARSSVPGSIVGYEDLTDDASGIIRMLELQGQLVVYKDTSIFLAVYTGVSSLPFRFTRLSIPTDKGLFYRNTLVPVEGLYHIYTGRNAFYRFDIQNRIPVLMKGLDLCSDLFFEDPDVDISATDDIFASVNPLTKEVWISSPSQTGDKVLCLDYKHNTMSTTDMSITAAAAIKRPTLNIRPVETEDWFVMGTVDGTLLLYGRVDKPLSQWGDDSSIHYQRSERVNISGSTASSSPDFTLATSGSGSVLSAGDGVTVYGGSGGSIDLITQVASVTNTVVTLANNAGVTLSSATLIKHMPLATTATNPYEGRLKAGLTAFGDPFDEKDLRSYVPHITSLNPSSTLGLSANVYITRNEHETPALVATKAIDDPNENLVSMFFRGFFFQDELVVDGKENPMRLHQRSYEVSRVTSKSTSRMDA